MPRATRSSAAAASAASNPPPANGTTSALPLEGCSVAASGTFLAFSHATLQKNLTDLGAKFTKSITAATTHLVATQEDFNNDSAKVAAAKAKGLPILKIEWVEEAMNTNARPRDDDFSHQQPSKKRPIAVVGSLATDAGNAADDSKDAVADTKKRRTAKGTRSRATAKAPDLDSKDADLEDVKPKAEEAAPAKAEKKSAADNQVAQSADLVVPVDEFFHLSGKQGFVVYIGDDMTIYDASLNQTNASANNNKFYKVQIVVNSRKKEFFTWTRWGRVGETGQKALLGDGSLGDARIHFDKKFKDKSGLAWENRSDAPKPKKYAYIERSYDPDSEDEDAGGKKDKKKRDSTEDPEPVETAECTLSPPIRSLVELIFNAKLFNSVMASLNYDANKLPLGKLGKGTITKGFQALKDLSTVLADPSKATTDYNMSASAATEHFSNLYYSLIPHAFGRNRPPIIDTATLLKKEVELLESLSDMKAASDIMKIQNVSDGMHQLDRQFQGLGLQEMTVLDKSSTEYTLLSAYLQGSKGSTHSYNYKIVDIFRVERMGERTRFNESRFVDVKSDKRLLWHGSRCTNFGGILSQGLRIAPPEAPVNGYMFGKGIYLADMSSKSAGYCAHHSSQNQALLLLCEAELGDPMQALRSSSYEAGKTAAQGGMISTLGMGRMVPKAWKDASEIHPSLKGVKMPDSTQGIADDTSGNSLYYNEYICYDIAQVQLRYLFRVDMS